MAPLVSVVMANFNASRFIAGAIESVLSQSVDDIELIIIDDASTDSSVDIISGYLCVDKRVRLSRHSQNRGISATLNDGVRLAQAPFITFLASDDLMTPDRLESELMKAQGNTKPAIVYSDPMMIDESTISVPDSRPSGVARPSGMIVGSLLADTLPHGILTIPKDCIAEKSPFDESLVWGNDYDLELSLARQYRFVYNDRLTYCYRRHPSQTTNTITRKTRYEAAASIISKHLQVNHGLLNIRTRREVTRKLIMCYVASRQYREAVRQGFTGVEGFGLLVTLPLKSKWFRRTSR